MLIWRSNAATTRPTELRPDDEAAEEKGTAEMAEAFKEQGGKLYQKMMNHPHTVIAERQG